MTQEYIRIIDFKVTGDHSLLLTFSDGLSRDIDFLPALKGNLYKPLRQPEYFRQVKLNEEIGNVEWPNEADFNPETLHDWPQHVNEYRNWHPAES